jgi:hypothetical protein
MIPFDDVVKELRKAAPGKVMTVCYDDMLFCHAIGAMDWSLADMICFQRVIRERGTPEEKARLARLIARGYREEGE